MLVSVKAGVEHLADKLQHLKIVSSTHLILLIQNIDSGFCVISAIS